MTNKDKITLIQDYLDSLLPFASCELFYNKDYELAIAVMLSAQTTDKKVNEATKILFTKFPTLESFANANEEEVFQYIKFLGLAKTKAHNVVEMAKQLVTRYDGILPNDKDELITLPGIGNKSAGVIRAEVFKIPDLPVDTHIQRLSYRFGFTKEKEDPYKVEQVLKKLISKNRWILSHHQFIHFGRYYCLARNPKCENCKLQAICNKK